MATDAILTISEVAHLLKVAQKTVYSLAQRAEIPAFKVGGQWRFSKDALDEWIAERSKKPPIGALRDERSKGRAAKRGAQR